jgi:hypothetical protein
VETRKETRTRAGSTTSKNLLFLFKRMSFRTVAKSPGARKTTLKPQNRVPHLRDSIIVAKMGIRASSNRFTWQIFTLAIYPPKTRSPHTQLRAQPVT